MPVIRTLPSGLRALAWLPAGAAVALAARFAPAADEGEPLFRERVLPVLEQNCFECHGPRAARLRGGLSLNGRDALLRGGDSGPAVVPGDADASLLVQAVRRSDPDLSMPPKRALAAEDVAAIERWVALGAPWPADLVAAPGAPAASGSGDAPAPESPPPTDPEALRFFETDVRPLLVERCHECHGPGLDKVKGGLRMSGRSALLRGGDRGPALLPGRPDDSLLVRAVRWTDSDLGMPPRDKLSPREIETLERWVALGAPWPDDGAPDDGAGADTGEAGLDLQAGREWWAFRPVVRPAVPPAADGSPAPHPIDAFVDQRLREAGLQPAPEATRAELARRASFDLLGLPPTYEELQAFASDPAPDAWPRLVDALLARPQYGERWGRHWLDVVRWAETDGYERDEAKPEAWRYRDWVIGAFNDDTPYDRFVLEQLAGDELPDRDDGSLVATGLYRLGVWDAEPDDPEQATFDELDDMVRTIGEGFLGLTLGCARCHDHKFDPLGQEDYYSTLAFLRNVRRYSETRYTLDSATLRPLGLDRKAVEAWEKDKAAHLEAARREQRELLAEGRRRAAEALADSAPASAEAGDAPESARKAAIEQLEYEERQRYLELTAQIEQPLKSLSFKGKLDWALVVSEAQPPVPETHVLVRGRASSPAQVVPPRFVRVLCASDADALPELPEPAPKARSSGRRLELARWIASPENPLTARVLVNRVWQHHFGRGLVETPNDFGRTGAPPSHPELLDWLAAEFVDRGWSIKELHRLIMSSAAYRRSSRASDPLALERDPGNALLARQNLRRLEAEALRDSVLAVSGTLDLTPGGPGFFPHLSREALAGSSRPGKGWQLAAPAQELRRTVYTFVQRGLIPPLLEVFDYGNVSLPVGSRPVTTLASQALTLLNGEFAGEAAAAFAGRVRREAGPEPRRQVERAFELALARRPDAAELELALAALESQAAAFARLPPTLEFRSLLPPRVDVGYLAQVQGRDVLFGPRAGWSYLPGLWDTPYNLTKGVNLAAGPAGLLEGEDLGDAAVEARVTFRGGCELGALLLRAAPDADGYTGVEALFEPPAGRARLVLHAAGEEPVVLAEAPLAFEADAWRSVRFEVRGSSASVWLDGAGEPLLAATDPALPDRGRFGVRAWGDAFGLADVVLTAGGHARAVPPDDPGAPAQRALQALCLALLNLNEFVYVD